MTAADYFIADNDRYQLLLLANKQSESHRF